MLDDTYTVPVTIDVKPEVTAGLATRGRLERLIRRTLLPMGVQSLFATVDALSNDVRRRGLTDETLQVELEAYNAERWDSSAAARSCSVAVSGPIMVELLYLLGRLRLTRFGRPQSRDEVLALLDTSDHFFASAERVNRLPRPKDSKYLELDLAARRRRS